MQKNNITEQILKIAFSIYIGLMILFGALAFLDYSLVVGWIFGGAVALTGYNIEILIVNKIFGKSKSKISGFWLGTSRFWIVLAYHAVWIIGVICVNRAFAGEPVFGGSTSSYLAPINLITYAAGIGVIPISTLVAHILQKKGGKHGN